MIELDIEMQSLYAAAEEGYTMKGTVKSGLITNIKSMAGGSAVLAIMQPGDYVYGTPGSTDLTGFTHFYRANGTKVELNATCKATILNLALTNEEEGTVTPPVPSTDTYTATLKDTVTGETWSGVLTKQ